MRILMSASAVSAILSAAMILFIGMTGAVFAGHHAAGEKAAPEMLVEKRIKRFKQSGGDIQAIFKKHIAAGDYVAVEKAATRIADWADVMPNYFRQAVPARARALKSGMISPILKPKRKPMRKRHWRL